MAIPILPGSTPGAKILSSNKGVNTMTYNPKSNCSDHVNRAVESGNLDSGNMKSYEFLTQHLLARRAVRV